MRYLLLSSVLLCSLLIRAQQHHPGVVKMASSKGSWQLQLMEGNACKIRFQPQEQWSTEQFSNAVIAKPLVSAGHLKQLTGGSHQWTAAEWLIGWDSSNNELLIRHDSISGPITLGAFLKNEMAGYTIKLDSTEAIYGGGERAISMNRRGASFPLYNIPAYGYAEGASALNFSVPFFLSSKGYAVLFDNPSKGLVDIGKSRPNEWSTGFHSGALDVYILAGRNMDEQLAAYTALTGRQPLPPRWVLGSFMSRFGYTSQQQVLDLVAKTKAARFPLDAVIFDLFWFGDSIKGTLGNLDWVNQHRWPDPAGMIDSLEKQQIKTILVTEPFVLEGTRQYDSARRYFAIDSLGHPFRLTDFYFGYGGLLDLFRADAGKWFWNQYEKQIKKGVEGWWGDLGEPEKHPAGMFHVLTELGAKKPVSADAIHNLYGHYWSKLLYEQYRRHYPDKRLFFLNRAGFAGSQRYSIFPWTGDVSRSWSGLRAQLPLLQGMSVSGIPYIHSDAGGFAGGDGDAELYTRWMQFAVFTPVFRPHGTMLETLDPAAVSIPSEPVLWPDSIQDIVREFVQLRYDMLPYNYSLAYEQTLMGKPLMRPMNYYLFSDSNLNKATSQYMWGDQLLVAPVVRKGATTQAVYFPSGEWYDYFTSRRMEGGKWEDVSVRIEKLPVYAKAGGFVPERTLLKNTEEYKTRFLVIKHFIGKEASEYTFFDDDGKNPQAIEQNEFDIIGFNAEPTAKQLNIIIGGQDRKYKGRVIKKLIIMDLIGLSERPSGIKLNGLMVNYQNRFDGEQDFKGQLAVWDPVNQQLRIVFEYTSRPHKLEVRY